MVWQSGEASQHQGVSFVTSKEFLVVQYRTRYRKSEIWENALKIVPFHFSAFFVSYYTYQQKAAPQSASVPSAIELNVNPPLLVE